MAAAGAKTLYWIRHARSLHNDRQEVAEERLLSDFPGSTGGTTDASQFDGAILHKIFVFSGAFP